VDIIARIAVEMALAGLPLGADGEGGSSAQYYNIVNNAAPLSLDISTAAGVEGGRIVIQGRPSGKVLVDRHAQRQAWRSAVVTNGHVKMPA
jgi:hypothetical protein